LGQRFAIFRASVDFSAHARRLTPRRANWASAMNNAVVLVVAADLPFAMSRFCGAEGLSNVVTLSTFRDHSFHGKYGVDIVDGPLKGLTARAVVVLDENNKVLHSELVPEIANEPNYEAALTALK